MNGVPTSGRGTDFSLPFPLGTWDSIAGNKATGASNQVLTPTVKVELSLYRPRRPLGLREVEAPTFTDTRLIDGGEVVSPTHRPLFTPTKIPGPHFS
jgi:hypothetical protein